MVRGRDMVMIKEYGDLLGRDLVEIGLVILEGIGDGKNNFDKIVRGLP